MVPGNCAFNIIQWPRVVCLFLSIGFSCKASGRVPYILIATLAVVLTLLEIASWSHQTGLRYLFIYSVIDNWSCMWGQCDFDVDSSGRLMFFFWRFVPICCLSLSRKMTILKSFCFVCFFFLTCNFGSLYSQAVSAHLLTPAVIFHKQLGWAAML